MTFCNILLFSLLSFASGIFKHVLGHLCTESLVGGFLADPGEFDYQAAILGKRNYSRDVSLICSGAVIDSDLILTSAQCFIDENGNFWEWHYYVEVDTVDLKSTAGIQISISKIYISDWNYPIYYKDLAIAKLKEPINFGYNYYFNYLDIPDQGESFAEGIGNVTAYGYTWVDTYVDPVDNMRKRRGGGSRFMLKYASVAIARGVDCINSYPFVNETTQHCGIMLTEKPEQQWGLCTKDTGSPLVINNKIVGIAIRTPVDCDDTVSGSIYTKVSAFSFFIELIKGGSPMIMEGTIMSSAIVYRNRRYFRRVPRR